MKLGRGGSREVKRREVLKGLSTVAGSSLFPAYALSIFSQQPAQQANAPLAVSIRKGKFVAVWLSFLPPSLTGDGAHNLQQFLEAKPYMGTHCAIRLLRISGCDSGNQFLMKARRKRPAAESCIV